LLPNRLTLIDETNRGDHRYLDTTDKCYFFGEYFAGKGYQGGGTNQLIFNFKCKPTAAASNPARRGHKARAIQTIAAGLRSVVAKDSAERITWIPIPPSKAEDDPDYDDRLLRTLNLAFTGYNVDVRAVLQQSESTGSDHNSTGERISPEALYAVTEVNQSILAAKTMHPYVFLFDDVLTTGKHFKCCQSRLREVLPTNTQITGLFVARRVVPNPFAEFEVFE
jgi:hypothetical protein